MSKQILAIGHNDQLEINPALAVIFARIGVKIHIIQANGDARLVGLPFARKQCDKMVTAGGWVVGNADTFFKNGRSTVDTLIIYGGTSG